MVGFTVTFSCLKRKKGEKGIRKKKKKKRKDKEQPNEEMYRAARSGWGCGGRAGWQVQKFLSQWHQGMPVHSHQPGSPLALMFQVSSGVSSRGWTGVGHW